MALCMTFGGSACPSLWGIILDTIADSCNSSIHNPHWDWKTLYDPLSFSIEDPKPLPPSIEFTLSQDFAVYIPINDIGKVDMYINDTIGVAINLADNMKHVQFAMPLVIYEFLRPLDASETTPRCDLISLKKFQAEERMEEIKTILGWIINTRILFVSLPVDNHYKLSKHIDKILSSTRGNSKKLEKLLGRLNHVAAIQSMIHDFLGRLHHGFL
jgi:hypothetical protein